MKLSKNKKILLLGTSLTVLSTSIVTPIVLLNKDEDNQENDVEKLFKILQAKTTKEKVIELSSNATGKIIADNQEKIIEKIKALIGKENLKEVKIEVLMKNDTNISTTPQKIIIKLIENEIFKEIKDFSVKRQLTIDEEIESIKKILDAKTNNDLIIILPNSSTGNIIGNRINKNAIIKKLRMLVNSSNINGDPNHPSLKGTTIEISMNVDAPISTTSQNIIVSISKTNGTTLITTKTFRVKRALTIEEINQDIQAIKTILDAKDDNNDPGLLITLPSNSSGSMINNLINKNAIERKIRKLIDSSNTNGDPNHPSLRGTTISLTKVRHQSDLISILPKLITITISKNGGTSVNFIEFAVKKQKT